MKRSNIIGWWEEYRCGCVSETVKHKKDLCGYCPKHGENARHIYPEMKAHPAPTKEEKEPCAP